MKTIRERLLERKVVQWLLAYVAGAFATLELLSIVGDQFNWPPVLQRGITILLGMGCLVTCVLAWYHGEKGRQHLSGTELLLLTVLLVLAGVALKTLGPYPAGPGGAVGPEPSPNSLAILYFDAPDGDTDLRAFADQLTQTLIEAFTRYGALDVRSELAVGSLRQETPPVDEIGRRLNVALIVSGRVHRLGEMLLVRVGLTEASTGRSIWSAPYEVQVGPAGELSLVEAVAIDLTDALRERLGTEIRRLESVAGTNNSLAWENLATARMISRTAMDLLDTGDFEAAVAKLAEADTLLLAAAREDPTWIEPHLEEARLAERRILAGFGRDDPDEIGRILDGGFSHVAHAFERDHTSPVAYYLRGLLTQMSMLFAVGIDSDSLETLSSLAQADFVSAVNFDPSLAAAWAKLALLKAQRGRYAEAYEDALMAYEQDAFLMESDQELLTTLAQTSFEAGREDEAVSWCREGQGRGANPMFLECELEVRAWGETIEPLPGVAQDLASRIERATLHVPVVGPYRAARVSLTLASALARAGYVGEARAYIDRSEMLGAGDTIRPPSLLLWEAAARARLGERELAVQLLSEFLENSPNTSDHLIAQRRFLPLRGYTPYETLVVRAGVSSRPAAR